MPDFVFDPADGNGPSGELTRIDIHQNGAPVTVINGWTNVTAHFEWELDAVAQTMAGGLGGPWRLRLDAESIGAGFEGNIYTNTVAVGSATWDAATGRWKYEHSAAIPDPGIDQAAPPGDASGIYKLVGSVWINGEPGAGTVHDMVAFDEVRLFMHEPLD